MNDTGDPSTVSESQPPPLAHLSHRRLALAQRAARLAWFERLAGRDEMIWSDEVFALLGLAPGPARFAMWRQRVHPDDRARAEAIWGGLEHGTQTRGRVEYRVLHEDGHWVTVRESCEAWRASDSSDCWILSAVAAIPAPSPPAAPTAPPVSAADDADQAVRRLAGAMAHDFNNLLTTILGNCHSLIADLPPAEPGKPSHGRKRLTQIQLAAERGSHLIQKVLAYGGRQLLQPETVDLGNHIRERAGQLSQLVRAPIELRIEADEPTPPVWADPDALDQAVVQLVFNARDALAGGGTIVVRVRSIAADQVQHLTGKPWGRTDAVAVEVQDDGCGIAPERFDRAFEPFFTTKPAAPGAGLGLSMVQGFARQSGGDAILRAGEDRGTTATILLPRCSADHLNEGPEDDGPGGGAVSLAPFGHQTGDPFANTLDNTASRSGGSPSLRILLVDDEPFVRDFMRDHLTSLGYDVVDSGNPLDALSLAERPGEHFDLMITDLVMPELRGDRLAVEVRRAQPHIKLLFITGYAGRDTTDRSAFACPCDGLLIKPFSPRELEQNLRAIGVAPGA